MMENKNITGKKKYDGFGIASFLAGILNIIFLGFINTEDILIPYFNYKINYHYLSALFVLIFIILASLSFGWGIIGLKRIKRGCYKAKWFALIGIIIAVIFVLYIIYSIIMTIVKVYG